MIPAFALSRELLFKFDGCFAAQVLPWRTDSQRPLISFENMFHSLNSTATASGLSRSGGAVNSISAACSTPTPPLPFVPGVKWLVVCLRGELLLTPLRASCTGWRSSHRYNVKDSALHWSVVTL